MATTATRTAPGRRRRAPTPRVELDELNQPAPLLERLLSASWLPTLLYAWFAVQATVIAVATRYGIPPDERAHVRSIQLYVREGLSPFLSTQEGFYDVGPLLRSPSYLYYWLLSFVARVVPGDGDAELVVLRLVNVALGVGTLIVARKLLEELGLPRWLQLLTLFLLVNTLMWVFLAGSVNYDNLVNLLSVASLLVTVRLLRELTWRRLVVLVGLGLAATLTKFTFVPLGALIGLVVAVQLLRPGQRAALGRSLRTRGPRRRPAQTAVAAVVLLLLVGLFVERWGGNTIAYGWPRPPCEQVLTVDQCLQYEIYERDLQWEDPGFERQLLQLSFGGQWFDAMRARTFSVMAHRNTEELALTRVTSRLLLIAAVVAAIRGFRRRERVVNALLFVAVGYVLVLLQVNYTVWLETGQFGLALQGRYAFPVLPVLYGLGLTYLARLLPRRVLTGAVVALIGVFAVSGLPTWLVRTDPAWWRPEVVEAVQAVQNLLLALAP